MIFNKQGTLIKHKKFLLGSNIIENVASYTYLGFTFIPSGEKTCGYSKFNQQRQPGFLSKNPY